jgi:hypothetical protein
MLTVENKPADYAECGYVKCHYAECRYSEYRGAYQTSD